MRHYRWSVETADQYVCRRILIRVLRGRQIHGPPVDALNRKLRRGAWIAYKPNYRLAALLFLPSRLRIISGLGCIRDR
jgi:hypothetical protein